MMSYTQPTHGRHVIDLSADVDSFATVKSILGWLLP